MTTEILIGLVVAAIIAGHGWLYRFVKFKMDEATIIEFLQSSDQLSFRSTEAISSDTNLTSERVAAVCSKSKSIKRNAKEKESWRLAL